jgi:hypothetical protein
VQLAPGAFAARLAADPVHGDEAAAQKGLLVEDLGKAGSDPPFGLRQMASVVHNNHLLLSDIFNYIR